LGASRRQGRIPHALFVPGNQSNVNGVPELPIATVIMNVAHLDLRDVIDDLANRPSAPFFVSVIEQKRVGTENSRPHAF